VGWIFLLRDDPQGEESHIKEFEKKRLNGQGQRPDLGNSAQKRMRKKKRED